jgi:hypothetical protein
VSTFATMMLAAAIFASSCLSRSVPTTIVMFAVAVVPAIFTVSVTADFIIPVIAKTWRQPSAFNTHPWSVVVVGPVVISIIIEVVVIANVDNIVGRPY